MREETMNSTIWSWTCSLVAIASLMVTVESVQAGPLTLEYQVDAIGGGLFDYEFRLVLDNRDGSFVPGQGWDWIVFGDQPVLDSSNLLDFAGDLSDLPIGPFVEYTSSSGGHNGPSLIAPGASAWFPHFVGDELRWSGTSTVDLPQGALLWSTLLTFNGARGANFDRAVRIEADDPPDNEPVPEPSSAILLACGAFGVFWRVRRAGTSRPSASGEIRACATL
jgi:hypothetical protein